MPIANDVTANGMLLSEQTGINPAFGYTPDALGSFVAAVDQNLNTTSTAASNPWGSTRTSTGTAPRFTWVGTVRYNVATGVPYAENSVRSRMVSTKLGRRTGLDPLWPTPDGFSYAGVSPLLFTDPSGEQPQLSSCTRWHVVIASTCTERTLRYGTPGPSFPRSESTTFARCDAPATIAYPSPT